jgi:hypothetical protein
MSETSVRFFAGTVIDESGNTLGEARMWGAGERGPDGSWRGWLRAGDLGAQPPPSGRYTITTPVGWSGAFEIGPERPARVFETDLLPVTGIGPAPWPEDDQTLARRAGRPPLTGTPWQGAQGMPPYKQQGDGNRGPVRLPVRNGRAG